MPDILEDLPTATLRGRRMNLRWQGLDTNDLTTNEAWNLKARGQRKTTVNDN